jgi:glutathione S-transferase
MITLYHSPRSRSSRVIWLLEELEAPYQIEIVPIVRGDGTGSPAPDSYLAVNPLRKVPTIKLYDEVVYESGAIFLFLTDSHQKHRMGPLPGEHKRADYLRWLFFCAGTVEPAVGARFQGWDKDKPTGFGKFEDVEAVISAQLESAPYVLGDEFSAADILLGSMVMFLKGATTLLPARKHYDDYVARITARPAFQRSQARDNG